MQNKIDNRRLRRLAMTALLGLSGVLVVGCGGGGDSSGTTGTTDNSGSTNTTTNTTTPGGNVPTSPRGPKRDAPDGGGAGNKFAQNAPAGKAGGATNTALLGPYAARDPFLVTWKQPPPPPNVFEEVPAIRVASAEVEIPSTEPIQVREVADRRVSGIMSGDGVYAILEQAGQSEVVKPGSVTSDGYKVLSINDDSVKLERREGNIIRTQTVQLSDAQTGPQTAGFGGGGGFGGFGGGGFSGGKPRIGAQGGGGGKGAD